MSNFFTNCNWPLVPSHVLNGVTWILGCFVVQWNWNGGQFQPNGSQVNKYIIINNKEKIIFFFENKTKKQWLKVKTKSRNLLGIKHKTLCTLGNSF